MGFLCPDISCRHSVCQALSIWESAEKTIGPMAGSPPLHCEEALKYDIGASQSDASKTYHR